MCQALFNCVAVVGFTAGLCAMVTAVLTVLNRNLDVPVSFFQSPYFLLWTPSKLTDRGKIFRRVCLGSCGVFIVCLAIAGICAPSLPRIAGATGNN